VAQAIPDDLLEKGIARLLGAPLTLKSCGAAIWEPGSSLTGSAGHRTLFEEYKDDVDYVTAAALQWWEETVGARKRLAPDDPQVVRKAWVDRPAGPASYPGLVALIRDYWIACHRQNLETAEINRVPPWTFLLAWLLDGNYRQCVSVLACMPYWPIGLDREGNWV
jgi:hypothetical protein